MNSRNRSLDVLRGLAVLLVICHHYPLVSVMNCGWIGVDLFFVLSGFLIAGPLFKEILTRNRINVLRLYTRRGFKIYPAFYVFLLTTAALIPAMRHYLGTESVFLQNYFPPPREAAWAHTWSLAVEEHFYIVLPLLLVVSPDPPHRIKGFGIPRRSGRDHCPPAGEGRMNCEITIFERGQTSFQPLCCPLPAIHNCADCRVEICSAHVVYCAVCLKPICGDCVIERRYGHERGEA